jgi:hypothetical protein
MEGKIGGTRSTYGQNENLHVYTLLSLQKHGQMVRISQLFLHMKCEGKAELKWLLGPFMKPSCSTNTGNFVNG